MWPGMEVLPIDDAAHDAFMTLPPYTSSNVREDSYILDRGFVVHVNHLTF